MAYHFKRSGEVMDQLFDKAETALQEHQDISHLAEKSEVQAELDKKQDNIEDLAEIRSGAKLGSTAIQDISHLATEDDVLSWLSDKVDKVAGKQLTTEDFTTALKEKLESLSNYNDADIKASIQSLQSQLNTLVDGDATSAIDTFNEIIAFLSSVEDTESLSGIISSIEQQIADKQDKIIDLGSIREGAAKGATALQEHQQLKTINGESIVGSGNITIQGGSGGSSGGSGIAIVDDVSKLDPNAALGTLATVVEPGSIQESSFRDLYQPDASMLDQNTGALTAPELLSSVSSVSVFAPKDVTSIGFEPVETMINLVTRDFSMTSLNMAIVYIVPEAVTAITITGGYDTMQEFILAGYSQDTMSYTIHNDQVEAFNAVLANGMDWCYLSNPESGFVITEEQFATIDLFVKAVAGIPSKAHVYLKNGNWEELYAKDFEKLASSIGKVEASVNAKADKMPIENYWSSGVKPNVYTTYTISSTINETINLADIADSSTYNEYIIEIKCTSTPSSVVFNNVDGTAATIVWANGVAPTFEAGMTYLMSIANGFGVYSMFPNS